jgi:hypothetical protein
MLISTEEFALRRADHGPLQISEFKDLPSRPTVRESSMPLLLTARNAVEDRNARARRGNRAPHEAFRFRGAPVLSRSGSAAPGCQPTDKLMRVTGKGHCASASGAATSR